MTAAAGLPGTTAPGRPQGLSAATILAALQRHYRRPGTDRDGEVLIAEAQAPGSARRADLVRVGMRASRGLGIDIHEIKTSRPDWRRELADPGKAEAWWPYCNRFWVVAPPGIVAAGELPEDWGLMEMPASGRRFKVRVPAAIRKDIQLTVPLLVELLRRADNQRLAEIDELRRQHRDNITELDKTWRAKIADGELSWETRQRLGLLQQIEDALGVPVDDHAGWPGTPVRAVTPAELAAFLADARDHVTLQRRGEDLDRERRRLRETADGILERLARPLTTPRPRHATSRQGKGMPGNPGPGADSGPSAPYIDLQAAPGGGMDFTLTSATGAPALDWSMSHGQALTFAARILSILGYREVHLRDDHTISSAS